MKRSNIIRFFIFILFVFFIQFLFICSDAYADVNFNNITISFNSHGGSNIDDITYSYDEEYGDLPVPTYDDNHVFDGWYKEDTYENKVSTRTKATKDIELHAKWIEETFPFVYPVQIEPLVCDGSNYVNTGVMLYDGTNWEKDYEIGFTIDEYDSDANENQAVFANTKYEVESLGWPGLTFRKAAGKLEITQNINGTKKNVTFGDYAPGYKVRIMRINKTIYYQMNDGQVKSLQSMSNFNQQFELPVYFCAGDNGSGGTQRHLKGTISNYYVRRGTYEDLETHTVTYPDGTVETYIHGSVLDLEANESTKASEVVSTVTFKPENGENDIESTVVKNYTPNGFMINGVHYDDEASLVVDEDKVITYSYDEDIDEAIFPDDPEKEHYDFDGWFDGDTEYTEYSGDTDITLTAEYTRRTVTITLPDEPPVVIDEGDSYDLSENSEAKPDDNIAEVTFKYHDDETDDLIRYVTKSYTPNGWIIDGVHYDDYASITPTKDITVIPDYIETINEAEFPSNPSRDNYEFMGWFTEETSGEKVTSYDGENDIILHAQWDMTLPTDFDIDSDDVLMVKGETHQIEVTFIPDGTSDTISYTSSDDNIATVSSDGLITAVDKGVITIIVSLDNVDVEKIITVTVVSDKLESETYDVLDKEKEEEPDDRIVIGAEPGTTIQEFKENMLNPVNYIKIYDGDTELSEDDIVKTGLTIKLEINGIVHDEAIIIVRGDINEDGLVNVIDKSILSEHVLRLNNIEGYRTYAADVDNNDSINITDKSKLSEYILRLIDSLNE